MLRRRVLLVEDHPMYRRGLRRLLEETGRYQIVGEAANSHQAIHLADIHHPESRCGKGQRASRRSSRRQEAA